MGKLNQKKTSMTVRVIQMGKVTIVKFVREKPLIEETWRELNQTITSLKHLCDMTDTEIITGNDEICRMLGWESDKVYVYKVPNTFPHEKEVDTGWIEMDTKGIGFHLDWNMLIGAYNRALSSLEEMTPAQKELFKSEKNMIVNFGTRNFFGLFENQLHISSSWVKLVDFAKWYNSVKLIK